MSFPHSSWLITGANRGIGYEIVSTLTQRPNTTVIAAVRDPSSAAKDFDALAQKAANGSKIIVVKINSTSEVDAKAAVERLKGQGINELDVVIANAGILNHHGGVASIPIKQLREHLEVNAVGPAILFQAVRPLLEQSKAPRFVYISSIIGSIGVGGNMASPMGAYGASKAAGNYLTVRIHQEHPSLTAFTLHPGVVATDMGKFAIDSTPSFSELEVTVDQSVAGILSCVDVATRENSGGKFKDFLQQDWPW